jgi:hypothetical protein
MHPVSRTTPPADTPWRVNAGDTVRLTMRDGSEHYMTIRTIDTNAIVGGDGTSYELTDIQSVERCQLSRTKTAFLAGGLIAGVILVATAAMLAAMMGGLGSAP